jgi:hypothetical protein
LSFGGGRNVRTPVISFLKRRKKRRRGRDERRGEERRGGKRRGQDRTGKERRGKETGTRHTLACSCKGPHPIHEGSTLMI